MADPAPPPVIIPDPPPQSPSPTGTPLVSAKLAPYFAGAAAVCAVIAGAAKIPGLHLPDEVFGYATLLALIFGTLLGTTPGIRKAVPMVLLVLSLGLTGCAHAAVAAPGPSMLQLTGATLDAAGDLFEATDAAMHTANPSLTADQRAAWNAFLPRWRAGYRVSGDAWLAASAKADQSGMQQAAAALGALLGELSVFAAMVQPKPGGV